MEKKLFIKRFALLLTLLIAFQLSFSQSRTLTGTVSDQDQNPLEKVSVGFKGGSAGTTTDSKGFFTLQVPEGTQVLVFSIIGYQTQELKIGKQTILSILLKSESLSLNDVIVVGYGSVKKSDLTGAISSVKARELVQLPVSRVDQALQGRAAGILVTNTDGAPGGQTAIRIRGASSISGGNNALIVLDGMQGADLTTIDPNDIESLEILKDASATAIYGAKGANGVILITTKSGKTGKPVFSYEYNYTLQKLDRKLPTLRIVDFANAINANRALANSTGAPLPVFSAADIKSFEQRGGTDWQDEMFRTAPMQNHRISVNGGTENINYFFSGGYLQQDGILKNSAFDRINLRANVNAKVKEWVSVGINLGFTKSVGNAPPFGDAARVSGLGNTPFTGQAILTSTLWGPVIPVYDSLGKYSKHPVGFGNPNTWNPVASTLEPFIKNSTFNNSINGNLDFKLAKGLELRVMGGAFITSSNNLRFFNGKSFNGRMINGFEGLGTVNNVKREAYQNTNILTYKKNIKAHNLTFTGVFEQQIENLYASGIDAQGFAIPAIGLDGIGGAKNFVNTSSAYDRVLNSYLGRANYSFNNKYLLTASYRADGSSVFGKNNKWGYFPSVAVGWNVSEESFIKNSNLISSLKLRGSWGIVGNQAIGPYQSLASIAPAGFYPYNGGLATDLAFALNRNANPNLKWESTKQTNIGVDFGFFKQRLNGSIDIYKKQTSDLLAPRILPQYSAVTAVIDNIGSTENKGIEFALSGDPLVGTFKWNTGFNITWNKNKVIDLGGTTTRIRFESSQGGYGVQDLTYLVKGKPMGQMYGLRTLGTWKESERTEAKAFGQLPGDQRYDDINKDGKINIGDETVIGSSLPKFFYGLSNRFSYKLFDLSVLFQGVHGNDIFNMLRIAREQPAISTSPAILNRWTPSNQNTDIPAFTDDATRIAAALTSTISLPALNANALSRYVEDGSYFRMKLITLGYNFSGKNLRKIGLTQIKAYVTATNLFTLTDYTGYDPEVSSFNGADSQVGIDLGNFPSAKTFTVGLQISL